MTAIIVVAMFLCMLEVVFTLAILFQICPKKEDKEKPINKFPETKIVLQFQVEDGCIYTLYNDFTWDVDTKY